MDGMTPYWHEFQWRRPRLTWYRTANRHRFKPGLNRYPGVIIGAEIVIGRRAVGVVWGRPGCVVDVSP